MLDIEDSTSDAWLARLLGFAFAAVGDAVLQLILCTIKLRHSRLDPVADAVIEGMYPGEWGFSIKHFVLL